MIHHMVVAAGSMILSAAFGTVGEAASQDAGRASGALAFSRRPTAAKDGAGVRIAFAVSAPTDVEVAVLDAAGKVVRHLAAGVLGGDKAPPAPLTPGLAQEIVWDGRDDDGKPVNGPASVRMRAGMKPEFDRFILFDPHGSGNVMAAAVGPGGQLYVFHRHSTANGRSGSYSVKVYRRDARHLRALAPFPADIAPERIKALEVFRDADGHPVPKIHNWQRISIYPDPTSARGIAMDNGMPAVDSRGRVYWLTTHPVLMALDADGGVPYERMFEKGPLLKDIEKVSARRPILAVSGDDKYVYVSGLGSEGTRGDKGAAGPLHCVFRVDAGTRAPGEPFIGRPDQAGGAGGRLTAPRGLAVAKGLIYVADSGADRVAAFKESDGSPAGEIKVKGPRSVGVDPASGAVYVCAVPEPNQSVLIKFENLKTGRELFRTQLPWTAHKDGDYFIAVDASANPVRLWIPSLGGYCPFGLKCLEDAGDKFVDLGDPRPQSEVVTAQGMRDLSVDRLRGELYVKSNPERWHRIDDRTGEVLAEIKFKGFHMANHATQLVACKDGSLVTLMWAENWMKRWTRDGAPLNWEGSDSNLATGGLRGIMTYTQKYLAVHGDEIYQVMRTGDKKYSSVNVYGMDGKPRRTAIWQCSIDAVPRLDARGNIFLGANVRPQGRAWPEFFDAALGPLPDRMNYGSVYWYSYMYGSVVKFPSSGGAVWFDQKASTTAIGEPPADLQARPRLAVGRHRDFDPSHKIALQGAEWYRFGFSPAHQYQSAGGPTCMCEGAGFDVDNYGRVFYPNLGRFRVEVIDNNNNVIGTFGRYGSEDSLGAGRAAEGAIRDPDSRISHPDIPLAWPTYVAVSDTYAYVNDILSRRVVRVRLGWTAEETCVLD